MYGLADLIDRHETVVLPIVSKIAEN